MTPPRLERLKALTQLGVPPSYPLAQFPNAPLALGLLGAAGTRVLHGSGEDHARAVYYLGTAVWAWLELTDGVNLFRRGLGGAALVYLAVRLGDALG
jgi:hypothetical protein